MTTTTLISTSNVVYFPIWIVEDRYSGVYSGYEWIAGVGYNLMDIILNKNIGIWASDMETWNKEEVDIYPFMAGGNTPNDSYTNLNKKINNYEIPRGFDYETFIKDLDPETFYMKKISHINDRWWLEKYGTWSFKV